MVRGIVVRASGGGMGASADPDPTRRHVRPLGRGREEGAPGSARPDTTVAPLLAHKLRPPRTQLSLVPRRALVQCLRESQRPLVVLSAPAGCGKTSTLLQWREGERRPVAWLSLDAADSDPAVFVTYLAAVLSTVVEIPSSVRAVLQEGDETALEPRVLPLIWSAVAEGDPFVLVVDDCHLMQSHRCWSIVAELLEQLPRGACVALSGRRDPPLRLARLRAAGSLTELRMERLALDPEEARQLLELHGALLDDRALAAVMDITEGWAAGVYMAAVLAEALPPETWLPHIRGDQRDIAAYLTSEALARIPQRTRAFLERTSVLDRMCADLCRAVTGSHDAGEELDRVAGRSLFVTALDDHGEWYRYHHLFAELLRAELARREPALEPRLHAAAASWLQEHSEPEAAVGHWLAAGDVASAMAAVKAARQAGLLGGRGPGTARLLRLFSEGQILADPSLTLFAGWIFALHSGTPVEQKLWGSRACRMQVDGGPSPMGASSLRSFQAFVRAYLAPDGITGMLRDAELTVQLETDPLRGWYLLARSTLAIALYLAGRDGPAEKMLADLAEREPRANDRVVMLNVLSMLAADHGDLERADALDRRALTEDPEMFKPGADVGYPLHFYPLLSHCRALSSRNDPAVRGCVQALEEFRARMVPQADYLLLWSAVVLGEVALEHGDIARARRWSEEAARIHERYPDAGILGARTGRLGEALLSRSGIEPLTPAERRVLELLQTHLTAEQIAARLFVSPNTVRTHTRALHRKLGAGTRAATVAKAVALGLLPARR